MSITVQCARCGLEAPGLERVGVPGKLGAEIKERICAACWAEWLAQEVRVINELKLNFMDPESPKILNQHLRQFLCLDDGSGPTLTIAPSH